MRIQIHVYHYFPEGDPALSAMLRLEARMSQLSDKIAELNTHIDTATSRVQGDIATLKAKIDELQKLVDSGGASQADLDALTEAEGRLDALDAAVNPSPGT